MSANAPVSDAVPRSWVDTRAPLWARPFLRLARADRPIGSWLLLIPCLWSAALAAVAGASLTQALWHMALFAIGAVAMRGAGCTWNDLVDRDIDARVERTRSRPLPSGQVSVGEAKLFLMVQALVGFIVLLQFNLFTIALGAASLAIIALYPFMKRITHWPQVVLGLAFSWGGLMGWAAAFGSLAAAPVLLYIGANLWVIGYDTIYAHQDREDDAVVGIKSTALLFGEQTRPMLGAFYAGAAMLIGMGLYAAGAGLASYAGLALFAAHLVWQVRVLDIHAPDHCLALFKTNRDAGLILLMGLLLDAAIR